MGKIITPEFLKAFKVKEDNSRPQVKIKLIHLFEPETWFLFQCNENGMAYGFAMGVDFQETGGVFIPELEKEHFRYMKGSRMLTPSSIIVDPTFETMSIEEAKKGFKLEEKNNFSERTKLFSDLIKSY